MVRPCARHFGEVVKRLKAEPTPVEGCSASCLPACLYACLCCLLPLLLPPPRWCGAGVLEGGEHTGEGVSAPAPDRQPGLGAPRQRAVVSHYVLCHSGLAVRLGGFGGGGARSRAAQLELWCFRVCSHDGGRRVGLMHPHACDPILAQPVHSIKLMFQQNILLMAELSTFAQRVHSGTRSPSKVTQSTITVTSFLAGFTKFPNVKPTPLAESSLTKWQV